eukprot:365510-Chlamydomonas_euryale.AAC.12
MCENVPMTNWGRVYYTNLLALFPLMVALPALNEQEVLFEVWRFSPAPCKRPRLPPPHPHRRHTLTAATPSLPPHPHRRHTLTACHTLTA